MPPASPAGTGPTLAPSNRAHPVPRASTRRNAGLRRSGRPGGASSGGTTRSAGIASGRPARRRMRSPAKTSGSARSARPRRSPGGGAHSLPAARSPSGTAKPTSGGLVPGGLNAPMPVRMPAWCRASITSAPVGSGSPGLKYAGEVVGVGAAHGPCTGSSAPRCATACAVQGCRPRTPHGPPGFRPQRPVTPPAPVARVPAPAPARRQRQAPVPGPRRPSAPAARRSADGLRTTRTPSPSGGDGEDDGGRGSVTYQACVRSPQLRRGRVVDRQRPAHALVAVAGSRSGCGRW